MSSKKPYLSAKEYADVVVKQGEEVRKLSDKFVKLMQASAEIAEYGALFLEYVNQFHSDTEKIVAMMNVFLFGVATKKISDDMKSDDKIRAITPLMLEMIRKLRS